MKTTTMSANDFIKMMEESDFNRCNHICEMFIDQCRASNPHMTHMGGADWLNMLINDYNVVLITNNDGDKQAAMLIDGERSWVMSILLEPKE